MVVAMVETMPGEQESGGLGLAQPVQSELLDREQDGGDQEAGLVDAEYQQRQRSTTAPAMRKMVRCRRPQPTAASLLAWPASADPRTGTRRPSGRGQIAAPGLRR